MILVRARSDTRTGPGARAAGPESLDQAEAQEPVVAGLRSWWSLSFSSSTFASLGPALLVTLLVQLRARLLLGPALGLLRTGNLVLTS